MNKIDFQNSLYKSQIALWSSVGLSIIDNNFIDDKSILDNVFSVNEIGLTIIGIYYCIKHLKKEHGVNKKINPLYNQIIENINDLNKIFNLKNPVEIYTMYEYMLYTGYLSKDHAFYYGNDGLTITYGPVVLSGSACCRHIASMLRDIFNNYGYTAAKLTGIYESESYEFIAKKDSLKQIEELIKICEDKVLDIDIKKKMLESLNILAKKYGSDAKTNLDLLITKDEEKRILARIIGNHAITSVGYENKSYFFDPTNQCIFKNNNKELVSNDGSTFKPRTLLLNSLNSIITNNKIFKLPNVDDKEVINYRVVTNNLCKNNLDIFEKFYQNNKEIYEEVSNTLSKVKK